MVELGVLTIDKAVPNSAEAEKKLLFLPGQLTDGIEESDDPLIDIRNGAYALSVLAAQSMISRSGVSFPKIMLARTGVATMLPTRWTARDNGASFFNARCVPA